MLVNKKWYSGLTSLPLLLFIAIGLNVHANSWVIHLLLFILGIWVCDVLYNTLVREKVAIGQELLQSTINWLLLQFGIIGLWYVSVLAINKIT